MIARRLSAFFTILAFVMFSGTWLVRKLLNQPVSDINLLFSQSFLIIAAYFLIGLFLARMGIALISEVLEERRRREDSKRERARARYLEVVAEEWGGSAPAAPRPAAPAEAEAE